MTCPHCELLRAALLDMCCQFCSTYTHKLHHQYQSDAERAFELLGIENGMTFDEARKAVNAAPSPLQSVITWIPVSERLPECRQRVMCVKDYSGVPWIGCWEGGKWVDDENDEYTWGYPTHWAELPPPPASEEETG